MVLTQCCGVYNNHLSRQLLFSIHIPSLKSVPFPTRYCHPTPRKRDHAQKNGSTGFTGIEE